jgi:hypothetical protein
MFLHIVLFRPKPGISDADRSALLAALERAAIHIPSVRRFHVGRRVTHGRGYEQQMTQDFPYAAVVEFDDLAGLQTYLQHPAHEELGARFQQMSEVGLIYDYEMEAPRRDPSGIPGFLQRG